MDQDYVSQEEIIEIVTDFLLASPPGEFMEVVTDIRGLLEDESIINESAPATFREYNTDQMLQIPSPGQKYKFLVCKEGEIAHGEYLDPRSGQIVSFDHIRQEVTGSRDAGQHIDRNAEPFRSAFDAAAQEYCSEHYQHGSCSVFGKSDGRGCTITVCISSSKFNPNNFWNGRWRAVWTCKVGGGQVNINGVLRVNVHYYEDGNVQLNTETKKQISSQGGNDPRAVASAAIKAIARCETEFHKLLENSYATMGDTTFKALRRMLPITRQRIDWTKIQNYKIGGDVGGRPMRGGRH
eukprot:CAMPEP_0174263312 /NCGR_PEP_ID=MMETSP0439-20130205/18129_1 /TAXON_ID=0 /ORGANISM="Stereomyxa ramosa, Strain Chinc5" /LENGTH=294 /DNA_ID=CAMNT_0015348599 /DNA_START=21 /DNA_END=905 /DNA_ORIENTATION=+